MHLHTDLTVDDLKLYNFKMHGQYELILNSRSMILAPAVQGNEKF